MIYFLPGLTKHTTVMVTTDEYEYEKDDDDHVAAEIEIGYGGNSYLHCTCSQVQKKFSKRPLLKVSYILHYFLHHCP